MNGVGSDGATTRAATGGDAVGTESVDEGGGVAATAVLFVPLCDVASSACADSGAPHGSTSGPTSSPGAFEVQAHNHAVSSAA